MKVRAHMFVSGKVQAVFFRLETKYEAEKYGVKGWIRNLYDGRVEAVFEGEEDAVRKLVEFCRQGPPSARVTRLDVTWEDYTGKFQDFKIRHSF
jgi:acylphosphatase